MNITGGTCIIADNLVMRCDPTYCARFHAVCSYGTKCVCAVSKIIKLFSCRFLIRMMRQMLALKA